MKNEQLQKSTKTVYKILTFFQGFCLAGAIACAVLFLANLILWPDFNYGLDTVNIGHLTLILNPEVLPDASELTIPVLSLFLISGVECLVFWFGVRILKEIVKPMTEGRPFNEGISEKIKKFAYVCLVGGFIGEVLTLPASYLTAKAYADTILNHSTVLEYSFNYDINLDFLILFAAVRIIAYVFKYGEKLQTESDETL